MFVIEYQIEKHWMKAFMKLNIEYHIELNVPNVEHEFKSIHRNRSDACAFIYTNQIALCGFFSFLSFFFHVWIFPIESKIKIFIVVWDSNSTNKNR